jgi:hypothetical protein
VTVNGRFELLPLEPARAADAALLAKLAELRRLSPTAAGLLEELIDAALVRMRLPVKKGA